MGAGRRGFESLLPDHCPHSPSFFRATEVPVRGNVVGWGVLKCLFKYLRGIAPQEEAMEEKNAVIQLLEGLLEKQDIQVYYKNRTIAFGDPELPVNAGVAFVRSQLTALTEAAKAPKE